MDFENMGSNESVGHIVPPHECLFFSTHHLERASRKECKGRVPAVICNEWECASARSALECCLSLLCSLGKTKLVRRTLVACHSLCLLFFLLPTQWWPLFFFLFFFFLLHFNWARKSECTPHRDTLTSPYSQRLLPLPVPAKSGLHRSPHLGTHWPSAILRVTTSATLRVCPEEAAFCISSFAGPI